MRRAIAILIGLLFLAPKIPAQTTSDWQNVERLDHGAGIVVKLDSGTSVEGTVESVSNDELQINTRKHRLVRTRTISRPMVVRVILIPPGNTRALRRLEVGMIAGGAAGATVGATQRTDYGKGWLIAVSTGIGMVVGGLLASTGVSTAPRVVIYKRSRAATRHSKATDTPLSWLRFR
jgi:hypothetical protein